MQKLKSYISIFFLVLLLFPIAEKIAHEAEHMNDEHCGVKETHFCQYEHNCSICDYVFSSFAGAPEKHLGIITVIANTIDLTFAKPSDKQADDLAYTFSLRGPPAIA